MDNLADELDSVAESLDGLNAGLIVQHRLNQYQQARQERGIKLTLKGIGGELYRDYIWLQDFPFYNSSKANVEKLYRVRMEMVRFDSALLTDEFSKSVVEARLERIDKLKSFILDTNTQSYDNIHFNQFLQSGASRILTSGWFNDTFCHAPLAEVHRLQHPFHKSRLSRFGGCYQKNFITSCSTELAHIKTTTGSYPCMDIRYQAMGLLGLSATQLQKVVRKTSQKYLNKSFFDLPSPNHPNAFTALRNSEFANDALLALKSHGVVKAEIKLSDINTRFFENLITLGWFINRLHD